MTTLISRVSKIDNFRIRNLPANTVIKVSRALRVGHETMFSDAKGNIYTHRDKGWSYTADNPVSLGMVKAMFLLGAITANEMNEHVDAGERLAAKKKFFYDSERFIGLAKELGLELTAEQIATCKDGAA